MNWFALIPLLIQYGPEIEQAAVSIWATATSNEDFISKFEQALPQAAALAKRIAAVFFPQAVPAVGQIATTVLTFNTTFVKYVQRACNAILSVNLEVDGSYGPLTHAAVEQLQTQIGGLTVDGIFGMKTWAAVKKLLPTLS